MKPIYVIIPKDASEALVKMAATAIPLEGSIIINEVDETIDLKNKKIVFVVEINEAGYSLTMATLFSNLYKRGRNMLEGSEGIILIHSCTELYTKSAASNIIFLANNQGCRFIGHPLIEATSNYNNFSTWQKTLNLPLEEICLEQCRKLGERFIEDKISEKKNPNILVLHASSRKTSNTLLLWNLIKNNMVDCTINELHVENGIIKDCIGCSFKTCMHYSNQSSCFYGGIMVEEIYPAIEKADAIIWICPNYNDALAANLTAVINRLTALYRKTPFYNKSLFGIVVSGNSGSDSVAKQLLDALNINKGFRLPPYFSMLATANDPRSVLQVPNIEVIAKNFADNILREIKI